MVASPVEIVIQIFQSVWQVYVAGTFRALPKVAGWLMHGGWFNVSMKAGGLLIGLMLARSMWVRMSDIGDGNPMVPVIAVALILGGAIATVVAHATGMWHGFSW